MKHLYSLHKRKLKLLMQTPDIDYRQVSCSQLIPTKQAIILLSKCVLIQNTVHGKVPQHLTDLMISSERLHVDWSKHCLQKILLTPLCVDYLPRTRTGSL